MSCLVSDKPLDARIDMFIRVCLEFACVDGIFNFYLHVFEPPVFTEQGRGRCCGFTAFARDMQKWYCGFFTEDYGLDWELSHGGELDEQPLLELPTDGSDTADAWA